MLRNPTYPSPGSTLERRDHYEDGVLASAEDDPRDKTEDEEDEDEEDDTDRAVDSEREPTGDEPDRD